MTTSFMFQVVFAYYQRWGGLPAISKVYIPAVYEGVPAGTVLKVVLMYGHYDFIAGCAHYFTHLLTPGIGVANLKGAYPLTHKCSWRGSAPNMPHFSQRYII